MNTCLKWHGGKSYLAKRIVEMMPPHTRYCEPFFGGGAVLFARDGEGVAEFVNDVNRTLTDFWQVLRETPDRMLRALWATEFSPEVFDAAANDLSNTDRVRRATAFFIRNRQSRQGLGKSFATPTSRTRRGMNENVSAWLTAVDGLPEFHARLRRVEIRNQDAVEFIQELDSPNAFFYCDPPYVHSTRSVTDAYEHEMTDADHASLLTRLSKLDGKFLLSGYPNELYDGRAKAYGWHHVDIVIDNKSSSAKTKEKKIERLWFNYELPGDA